MLKSPIYHKYEIIKQNSNDVEKMKNIIDKWTRSKLTLHLINLMILKDKLNFNYIEMYINIDYKILEILNNLFDGKIINNVFEAEQLKDNKEKYDKLIKIVTPKITQRVTKIINSYTSIIFITSNENNINIFHRAMGIVDLNNKTLEFYNSWHKNNYTDAIKFILLQSDEFKDFQFINVNIHNLQDNFENCYCWPFLFLHIKYNLNYSNDEMIAYLLNMSSTDRNKMAYNIYYELN